MRYTEIKTIDVANGPGIRVSLWVQGCSHHCKGCFNAETWDFNGGKQFTQKEIDYIKELLSDDVVQKHFSILGGDPLEPINHYMLENLLIQLKEKYPHLNIWLWTGYNWEQIKHLNFLKYIDVIVDGEFIEKKKDLRLKFKGSSNQRTINVKESLKNNDVVLMDL